MKNIRIFISENFPFLVIKFSIYMYLNRHVFVMLSKPHHNPVFITLLLGSKAKTMLAKKVLYPNKKCLHYKDIVFYITTRKHAYITLTPLNPTFIKPGLQGYTLFFLFCYNNTDLGTH